MAETLIVPKTGPENCSIAMDGHFLILKIDTTKPVGKTKNGKSVSVGTTHGVAALNNGLRVNVNVTRDL